MRRTLPARSLEVVLDASLAGGTVAGSLGLSETAQSLNTKLRLVAENVSLDTLRGYIGRPPEFLAGRRATPSTIEADGIIDAPRTWTGSLQAQINNLRQENLFFDRVHFEGLRRATEWRRWTQPKRPMARTRSR